MQLYSNNSVASIISKVTDVAEVLDQPLIRSLQRKAPQVVARFLKEFANTVAAMQEIEQVPKHTRPQLMLIASDFVEKYQHESLADIMLMLKMARRGDFGKTFARINPETLHKWMDEYLEQKIQAKERRHHDTKTNKTQRTGYEHTDLTPENQKILADIRLRINKNNPKAKTHATKTKERQSFEQWAATQTELATTATELELLQLATYLDYNYAGAELLDHTTKTLIAHVNEQIQIRLNRCNPAQLLAKLEEAQEPVPHPTKELQKKMHLYREIQRKITIAAIEENLNNRI